MQSLEAVKVTISVGAGLLWDLTRKVALGNCALLEKTIAEGRTSESGAGTAVIVREQPR
jgi:hypothetical protein